MKSEHEIVLLIAYNLMNQNQIITVDAVQQSLRLMQPKAFDLKQELQKLVTNGYLSMIENTLAFQNSLKIISLGARRSRQFIDRAFFMCCFGGI